MACPNPEEHDKELRLQLHEAEWKLERAQDELVASQHEITRLSGALDQVQSERNMRNSDCTRLAFALLNALYHIHASNPDLGMKLKKKLESELEIANKWHVG